jgi:hypothetical protein
MTSNDLEPRLRRAFDEVSSEWQPNGGSASDFVRAVSRRRARKQRTVVTVGCAVAVVLALVVGGSVYSASRTDSREASGTGLHGSTPSTPPGPAAVPGLPESTASPQLRANPPLRCVKVRVESGVPQCAGAYLTVSSASSGSAQNIAGATVASPTSATPPVTVEVGHHVTIVLPATASGSWTDPTAVDVSMLSPTLRQELPVIQSTADPGVIRVADRVRRSANQSVTAVFEAAKPGDVVLMSTLTQHCARTSPGQPGTTSPACPGGSTRWLTVLVVVPR